MGRPAVTARDILLTLLGRDGEIRVPEKAPNMAALFAPLLKNRHTKPQLTRAVYRLRKLKLVRVVKSNGHTVITLTQNGKKLALKYALDEIELERPFRWDGSWHLVMFDVPNIFRVARNALRTRLKRLGLVSLQESVWISPYPCRDEVRFLAQMLGVGGYIKTMTVSALDDRDSARLKQIFEIR